MREHLAISLDNESIVLRTVAGEGSEPEPALLSGNLLLRLTERTTVKDISLVFSGRCKISYSDPAPTFKSHTYDQPIFFHNFAFLPESHAHTLNAGVHSFPFSLHLPVDLPATLKTFLGSAAIDYRLKAVVTRAGLTNTQWTLKRPVLIHRGLGADAIEFNSTVEIENTWPNKLMYSFTMPHKAHVAGTDIPVSIRFTPLVKGVRVLSIHTEIRENSTLYGKNDAQHNESYPIFQRKTDLEAGSNTISRTHSRPPSLPSSAPLSRVASRGGGTGSGGFTHSDPHSGHHSPRRSPNGSTDTGPVLAADLSSRLANMTVGSSSRPVSESAAFDNPAFASRVSEQLEMDPPYEGDDDADELPPEEVHMVLEFPVRANSAPSNSVSPVLITHRIKWSCLISYGLLAKHGPADFLYSNPDGHTSELRCALPLMILDNSFEAEARLASTGARNLLFGPSGALMPEVDQVGAVDLPSYQDHVRDRIGDASRTDLRAYQANPWAVGSSQHMSVAGTPIGTPMPSRPSSPVRSNSAPMMQSGVAATANWTPPSSQPSTPSVDLRPNSSSSSLSRFGRMGASPGDASASSSASSGFFSLHGSKARKPFANLTRHSPDATPTDMPANLVPVAGASSLGLPALPVLAPAEISANPNADSNGEGPDWSNVPPYEVASDRRRAGVIPLDTIRGLPDYDVA